MTPANRDERDILVTYTVRIEVLHDPHDLGTVDDDQNLMDQIIEPDKIVTTIQEMVHAEEFTYDVNVSRR
jgi:hypothetical protein